MLGILVRLILLALVVYVLYSLYRSARRILQGGPASGGAFRFAAAEDCPACGARIRVGQDPVSCPKCGEKLGRGPNGKLLIRIN
jgi:hypothetical protein